MKLTRAKGQSPIQTLKQVLCDVLLFKFESRQDELLNLLFLQEKFTFILLNALEHAEVDESKHVETSALHD